MIDIKANIPHRDPFLFVDKVLSMTDESISTELKLSLKIDSFRGHYPGFPIFPGVLMAEFAFQSAALLLSEKMEKSDKDLIPVVTRIKDAKFKSAAFPDDRLSSEITITEQLANAFYLRGKIKANDRLALDINFAVAMVEKGTVLK